MNSHLPTAQLFVFAIIYGIASFVLFIVTVVCALRTDKHFPYILALVAAMLLGIMSALYGLMWSTLV